ncbi:hypothetical protein [Xanthocytophaga flava]|uniref:hypothetical protein n=1 Tax=Xanthocytophaga flava TaxID=3048013 RepID=UPI0028D55745|nr:hypothetical protein [Xanthocytophaga flavus]
MKLLQKLVRKYSYNEAFSSLEALLHQEGLLNNSSRFADKLFDHAFINSSKHKDLIIAFTEWVNQDCQQDQRFSLYIKGFIRDVSEQLVIQNVKTLDQSSCEKICIRFKQDQAFILNILLEVARLQTASGLTWVYDLALKYIGEKSFDIFDQAIVGLIGLGEYFKYWISGTGKILPKEYLDTYLNEDYDNYISIKQSVYKKTINGEEIIEFLLTSLSEQTAITSRDTFYKLYNHIRYLTEGSRIQNVERLKSLRIKSVDLILWYLGLEENLDYQELKQKFVYFSSESQIRIFRRLFHLKARGQLELTIDKLDELSRFDLDLYKSIVSLNPHIGIDVSTDIIIKALKSFQQSQRFLVVGEVLQLVLQTFKHNPGERFQLGHYFEKCQGRENVSFNWNTFGEIKKVSFGNQQFYFAISIRETTEVYDQDLRTYTKIRLSKDLFNRYISEIRSIAGAKWNENEKHWGIPARNQADVFSFARKYGFLLDIEGSKYANNTHLASFYRYAVPNGVQYCEARLANKPDELFNKPFWWCCGDKCYGKCETKHTVHEWEQYTLFDFCEILELNTDEVNRMGDSIPKGKYYQFIGLINQFNQLLEKLYCQDCNHLLHPIDTSHFASRAVVRFHCVNEKCSNREEIYLNHCLNSKCNSIIDSRVSKKCSNGLFICDKCGGCCSNEMFERRLSSLTAVGGYIHDQLRRCVQEKLGHWENGAFFCYKCSNAVVEKEADVFYCDSCNVSYNRKKFTVKKTKKEIKEY